MASNNILVFVEQRGGKVHSSVCQLMSAARDLAGATGGSVEACIVGSGIGDLANQMGALGAGKVYVVDDPELERYRAMSYATALCSAIEAADPKTVLIPTTFLGRDLASRVGARKRAAMVIDCTEVAMDGDDLLATTTLYCGKTVATFRMSGSRLQIATIRANAYPAAEVTDGASAETVAVAFSLDGDASRAKCVEIASTSSGVKDVTEGDIVVAGGRAMKSEDNFNILFELAETLDGAVGASRAACDAGYQSHNRQVGLTGKVVTPALYIACGIDGAIQHLAGMRGSKVIVAVNTKKEAPIFGVSTYGCVCDLFVLVPLLTQEFKKLLQG